jgi:type IV secretion system protein TrbL
MTDFNVVDNFLQTFITYIDGGFGLLGGDVSKLSTTLVAIDVTLAALFWLLDGEMNVFARLFKKVLYVGAFAFIIGNFSSLATIIYNSFSQLGLTASANNLTPQDLMRPGKLAGTGFTAAWPLLQEAGKLIGFTSFFSHVVTIMVLIGAWFIVVLAFFVLAIQLFITILEFKLTTLAGFVLVPFALWNKTAFLAERVLGNVVSSGIKVMVLAVIVGIGSSFFGQFTNALQGDPTLTSAVTLVLAALSLLGLGIFGPSIASGLVSGGPQLGAGSAIGTAGALVGGAALAGAALSGGASAIAGGGMAALRAGTSLSSGAATAYGLASATSGASGGSAVGAGLSGVAKAAAGTMAGRARGATGAQAAWTATGGKAPSSATAGEGASANESMPPWARRLQSAQSRRGHSQAVTQAIKEGDRPVHGEGPDLDNGEG